PDPPPVVLDTQPAQERRPEREHRLADVEAGEALALQHQHVQTAVRQRLGGRRSGRATPDDDDVVLGGRGAGHLEAPQPETDPAGLSATSASDRMRSTIAWMSPSMRRSRSTNGTTSR